ncbi:MAG TPA: 3-phosphoglycerate dehydrogenase family protein [Vicinamibacterales bacterium]|nr:3-phosphoglycerate dehydrogenase family protein [Vicinamibacterales bacterium]
MKILVADKFEQSGIDGLTAAGCDVIFQPDLKDDALRDAIARTDADVLVVRGTGVTAAMLEAGTLSLIVRAGAGYNTIDVAAASRRGIYVSNCPGKNAIAVAELTLGLILALDRRIPDSVAELRAGKWNKKEFSQARGIFGSTLGLIGYGSIGQEVARRALAFGMPVVVWSRRFASGAVTPDLPVKVAPSLEAIAAASDIVSVHLALSKETRGLIGEAFFSSMKKGAMFINTARGEVVDYAALERAVKERGLRAGLDVFPGEPAGATAAFETPLAALPNVYGTHHVGGSTDQAQDAIAAETVRVITSYMTTGRVPNVVNLARTTPATHMLVVRHRDRPGVLAHVFDQLRRAGLNVQETENIIFEGAEAAVARINIDGAPAEVAMAALRSGNDDLLDVRVVPL